MQDRNRNVLKTVLEDAKGSRTGGNISFGDVKADLHYTESKDTVCLLYYPKSTIQGGEPCRRSLKAGDRKNTKKT